MNRNKEDFPVIIGQSGPLHGQRWKLTDTVIIGRDSECQIVIPERQVSRYHARISMSEEGYLIEDLGSKNGTFINGNRLEDPVTLQDGDFIQISMVQKMAYLSSDATMPMDFIEVNQEPEEKSLYLDSKSRRVWINKQEVIPPLSVPQFRLLQALFTQQGKVVSRQDIIYKVWGDSEALGVSEQALDALVRRLRDRLAKIDTTHPYIVTVRGHGLRLDNPSVN